MVANIVRYRPRSAVRDVGKALGIPETALDRAANISRCTGWSTKDALRPRRPARSHANAFELLARLSNEISSCRATSRSIPVASWLGHEPVHDIVPIENATMPGRTVIQWDKDDPRISACSRSTCSRSGRSYQLHLAFDLLKTPSRTSP